MLLEVRNLNKSFGAIVVADDVTLDVEDGEALGIIGPNGAGKTSLFNLLTGASVMAKDLLFATLDPTLRQLDLPNGWSPWEPGCRSSP